MANKYIKLSSGQFAEQEATVTSTGVTDAGKIVALDASGKLDNTVMPSGIGTETVSLPTSENFSAGDIVNIYSNGGVATARKADASNGRRAHGFVLSATTSPNNASIYLEGSITGLSSLTPGAPYYVSGATAGAVVSTAPTTATYIVQEVGIAASTTVITFSPARPVMLA